MYQNQVGTVAVDDEGKIMGLVTDYDIGKHIEKEENIFLMEV
jgi:signal-transduction protein with cAMP-binding, CBS, and nucleotidyltransferase domain